MDERGWEVQVSSYRMNKSGGRKAQRKEYSHVTVYGDEEQLRL